MVFNDDVKDNKRGEGCYETCANATKRWGDGEIMGANWTTLYLNSRGESKGAVQLARHDHLACARP